MTLWIQSRVCYSVMMRSLPVSVTRRRNRLYDHVTSSGRHDGSWRMFCWPSNRTERLLLPVQLIHPVCLSAMAMSWSTNILYSYINRLNVFIKWFLSVCVGPWLFPGLNTSLFWLFSEQTSFCSAAMMWNLFASLICYFQTQEFKIYRGDAPASPVTERVSLNWQGCQMVQAICWVIKNSSVYYGSLFGGFTEISDENIS